MSGGNEEPLHPYARFAYAEKLIAGNVGWASQELETAYIWFDATLEVEGVVERGFVLHGGCYRDRPDCHVSFEIRLARVPGRSCIPIMRVDWRSLQGGHTNMRTKGVAYSGRRVSDTHRHSFDLNWDAKRKRMRQRGELPFAEDIDEPLETFDALLRYVGKVFRINNIEVVPWPDWQYKLL